VIGGRVLDPTAVAAIVSGTSDYADALLAVANDLGITLGLPATALQPAWANCPPADRPWLDQLPDAAMVVVLDLDQETAKDAGLLAAGARMPEVHLAASHAALTGIRRGWPVVTRRPDVIQALSGAVTTETMP
jgi:hypothetical protein